MSDVRHPELRESPGTDIREWLKESFQGAEWGEDDSPVDFDDSPVNRHRKLTHLYTNNQ
jgi:hypothetical protein